MKLPWITILPALPSPAPLLPVFFKPDFPLLKLTREKFGAPALSHPLPWMNEFPAPQAGGSPSPSAQAAQE